LTGFIVCPPLGNKMFCSAANQGADELKARYSYQIKLRDTGSYGFLLPKENIIPTGEEMLNALKYFGDFLLGNNGIESFPARSSRPDDRKDLKRRDFTG
jgi:extracellular matrix protein 14